jgi:hypothetical protein
MFKTPPIIIGMDGVSGFAGLQQNRANGRTALFTRIPPRREAGCFRIFIILKIRLTLTSCRTLYWSWKEEMFYGAADYYAGIQGLRRVDAHTAIL